MERVSVKNLSTILGSILVCLLVGSGIYNTFYVDFRISSSIFDDSKFTVVVVDYLPAPADKKVVKVVKPRKRLTYSQRRPKTFKNAVEVKDPRENKTDVNKMAHIKSNLNLELVEFSNAKRFKKVLKNGEAEGTLVASEGYIETLEIFLPNDEEITADFTEMNGNVFAYDHGGETYSGLIYQSGNSNYTVTLVNGPFQGSRMKFASRDSGERALSYAEIIEEDRKEDFVPEAELDEQPIEQDNPYEEDRDHGDVERVSESREERDDSYEG